MSIRCELGWHKWAKYGPLIEAYAGLTQFRRCCRCGRISYAKCYGNQAKATIANNSLNYFTEEEIKND